MLEIDYISWIILTKQTEFSPIEFKSAQSKMKSAQFQIDLIEKNKKDLYIRSKPPSRDIYKHTYNSAQELSL